MASISELDPQFPSIEMPPALIVDEADVSDEVVDEGVDDSELDPQVPNPLWLFKISKSVFAK